MLKLNEDLILNYIEENKTDDEGKLITLELSLNFYGKHYTAYLLAKSLEEEKLSYPCIEGPSVLFESLEESLEEDEEIIKNVRAASMKFVEEYNRILSED